MKIILFALFSLVSLNLQGQNLEFIDGDWEGLIEIQGQDVRIDLIFTFDDHMLDGAISIPQQQASNLPVYVLRATTDSLVFEFQTGNGSATFFGRRSGEEIEGTFEQAGMAFPFLISKIDETRLTQNQPDIEEITIPLRENGGELSGTLVKGEPSNPIAILLTGSGSQDRNETVAGFGIFKELADILHDHGFSSFRYDDRGVGRSSGNPDATLSELAGDTMDIIEYLKSNYSESFSGIVLIGHSQGGLVATLTASETEVDGIFYMAAPFLSGDQIINGQIEKISELQGIKEEIVEQNLDFQNRIYTIVRNNGDWQDVEDDLASRLEDQINELPEAQRDALGNMDAFIETQVNRQLAAAKSRWFKSFIEYDPAEDLSSLSIPMLAVFGEKDVQVLSEPNTEAASSLSNTQNGGIPAITIPEANHLFQKAETGTPGEYGALEKEFIEGFDDILIEWLRNL